jgi:hypothetical protein
MFDQPRRLKKSLPSGCLSGPRWRAHCAPRWEASVPFRRLPLPQRPARYLQRPFPRLQRLQFPRKPKLRWRHRSRRRRQNRPLLSNRRSRQSRQAPRLVRPGLDHKDPLPRLRALFPRRPLGRLDRVRFSQARAHPCRKPRRRSCPARHLLFRARRGPDRLVRVRRQANHCAHMGRNAPA